MEWGPITGPRGQKLNCLNSSWAEYQIFTLHFVRSSRTNFALDSAFFWGGKGFLSEDRITTLTNKNLVRVILSVLNKYSGKISK